MTGLTSRRNGNHKANLHPISQRLHSQCPSMHKCSKKINPARPSKGSQLFFPHCSSLVRSFASAPRKRAPSATNLLAVLADFHPDDVILVDEAIHLSSWKFNKTNVRTSISLASTNERWTRLVPNSRSQTCRSSQKILEQILPRQEVTACFSYATSDGWRKHDRSCPDSQSTCSRYFRWFVRYRTSGFRKSL